MSQTSLAHRSQEILGSQKPQKSKMTRSGEENICFRPEGFGSLSEGAEGEMWGENSFYSFKTSERSTNKKDFWPKWEPTASSPHKPVFFILPEVSRLMFTSFPVFPSKTDLKFLLSAHKNKTKTEFMKFWSLHIFHQFFFTCILFFNWRMIVHVLMI